MKPSEGLAGQEAQLARLAHGLEVARAERNVALRERDEERHRLNEVLKEREAVLVEFVQQRDKARMAFEQMAADVLAALAGAGIATPEKGYAVEPWAVRGDIGRLAMKCEAVQVDSKNLRHALGLAIASEARVRRVLKKIEERHPGEVDREWASDVRRHEQSAEVQHVHECAAVDPKPTPKIDVRPVATPPDRPKAKRHPRAHEGSPRVIEATCDCGATTFHAHDADCAMIEALRERERAASVELALKDLGAKP